MNIDSIIEQIQQHADRLQRSQQTENQPAGWRFLCVSKKVLAAKPPIALLTLNPGGETDPLRLEHESCEDGCAYSDEEWGNHRPGEHPLQKQVQLLFDALAARLTPGECGKSLMQRSLVGYFVPFRSRDEARLNQSQWNFGREIWAPILTKIRPRLILTIDRTTFRYVSGIIRTVDASFVIATPSTGWGAIKACICDTTFEGSPIRLVRLPHLSRFRIFGRDAGREVAESVESLCKQITAGISVFSSEQLRPRGVVEVQAAFSDTTIDGLLR